jgi:hypothetical protein
MGRKDKAGFFMLDVDSFKRPIFFDMWEDDGPETENLVADVLPIPTRLRPSKANSAGPEIEEQEKKKSAA